MRIGTIKSTDQMHMLKSEITCFSPFASTVILTTTCSWSYVLLFYGKNNKKYGNLVTMVLNRLSLFFTEFIRRN